MLRFEIVLRKPEEIQQLRDQVTDLQEQLRKKDQEIYRMGLMVGQSLQYLDWLRESKELLDRAGIDSSFIQIRKSRF